MPVLRYGCVVESQSSLQNAHILYSGGEIMIAAIGFSGSGRGALVGNLNENL